ncbi:carbohydrate binding domain-containing protein [Sphingomonas jejuensis]|nr:carbohydrate binding domain-containing protein [Sphingomonas jejuensis]
MIALAIALAAQAVATGAGATVIDDFESLAPWEAAASDGVRSTITPVPGEPGQAMRLSYDFGPVSGYAFARRALPIRWPERYEIRLRVRGTGGVNDLQIKFADASGDNVWWFTRPNFRPTAGWQTIRIRPSDMSFAWGPTADKVLRETASMEVTLVRGRDGGAGTIEVDTLSLEALPAPTPLPPPSASAPAAIDGRVDTAAALSRRQPVTVDFGGVRPLGGVTLRWAEGGAAYRLEGRGEDGSWQTLRTVERGDGGDDPIALPDAELTGLRLSAARGRLAEIVVHEPAWAEDLNGFVRSLAIAAPRGTFPRGFSGEQSYWTLVARLDGTASGLIGEDGAVEVAKGGFSIEPFVEIDGRRIGWADVRTSHALEDGYLPVPHVDWEGDGWRMRTTLFADAGAPRLMARWEITNHGDAPKRVRLLLAVRPFQVNPPAQFLSQQGGVSRIEAVRWADGRLAVTSPGAIDGDPAVVRTLTPVETPTTVAAIPFSQGALADPARATGLTAVSDETGLASATMVYERVLAPGESIEAPIVITTDGSIAPPMTTLDFGVREVRTVADWRVRLRGVSMTVPARFQPVADTLKTALAHVLMSRDGPALKPGTRSYDRSWIRDGAMMGDTLLRLGVVEPVADFADWYGTKLFENGKVPCCVDFRGADPVPENDSHGQYIHLVTQLYRFTGDRQRLAREWPALDAARRYMEELRQSERTAVNQTPERRMLYGLMPPSISHEGYSAKAQYSLWDDFWALTGYKDAAFAAQVLERPEAAEITRQRDEFGRDVHAAILAAVDHWDIDFIPGATSLGDFDATSTTMALDPAGEQHRLNPDLLARTFAKQWERVSSRDAAGATWPDYTPYELRNVSAFVRLGWRERANALLDFYMDDRRPHAWNGWAEVVGRDPREVRFIGDMPHAWVASDFIRAALDLFAYEDGAAIVLGGGMTPAWLSGDGIAVRGMHTAHGTVDLTMRADGPRVLAEVGGSARTTGGYRIGWPLEGRPGRATVDGIEVPLRDGMLVVPADGRTRQIVIERAAR